MKKYPLTSILILATLGPCCHQHSTRWKGTVSYTNGTAIIENPNSAFSRTSCFRLELDGAFGERDGLSRIKYAVDRDGGVFILDAIEKKIRRYDRTGAFVSTFGRAGQGPGEFDVPVSICVNERSEVIVHDGPSNTLKYFSASGKFKKQVSLSRLAGLILSFEAMKEADLVFLVSQNPWTVELIDWNPESDDPRSISRMANSPPQQGQIDLSSPSLEFAASGNDRIMWGTTDSYKINVSDTAGRIMKTVIKRQGVVDFPAYEKEKLTREMAARRRFMRGDQEIRYPSHAPAFDSFWADDQGWLYVRTYGERAIDKIDVFNAGGIFIGDVSLSEDLKGIRMKQGKLYAVECDPEGVPHVARYRIIWNISEELRSLAPK